MFLHKMIKMIRKLSTKFKIIIQNIFKKITRFLSQTILNVLAKMHKITKLLEFSINIFFRMIFMIVLNLLMIHRWRILLDPKTCTLIKIYYYIKSNGIIRLPTLQIKMIKILFSDVLKVIIKFFYRIVIRIMQQFIKYTVIVIKLLLKMINENIYKIYDNKINECLLYIFCEVSYSTMIVIFVLFIIKLILYLLIILLIKILHETTVLIELLTIRLLMMWIFQQVIIHPIFNYLYDKNLIQYII